MKLIVAVALACVALAAAAPADAPPKEIVQILRSEFDQSPDGAYVFGFESEDGITRQENGERKTVQDEENKPREVVVVRGSYSYPGEDGKLITINYFADETGFHAEGDSIPKAAPARR